MQHFTCDLCGREIDRQRYIVRMEVYPAFDPDELSADPDADHLDELAELISQEILEEMEPVDPGPHLLRFDLCENCRRRFLQDPLGRSPLQRSGFSSKN